MKLAEYKSTMKLPLLVRTVAFLKQDAKVLLGYKKQGFGKGNMVGIGGKVEEGEKYEHAAARELAEEIKIANPVLKNMGELHFYFPHVLDESWNQSVFVFTAKKWEGEPGETEEIRPEWFDIKNIPYYKMWDDAKYWLPKVLEGQKVHGEFLFDKDLKVVDFSIVKMVEK